MSAGAVRRLTSKELADPEYMQAYVDECFRTVDTLIAERAALHAQAVALAQALRQCLDSMAFAKRHIGDEGMRHWPDDAEFDASVEAYEKAQEQAQALLEAK